MSKFIDKLKRLSRGEPQPMGFRTIQQTQPRLKIQLVASVAQEKAEALTGHIEGADAGLLRISKPDTGLEALKKVSRTISDIPWGGWFQGKGQGEIDEMTRAGCDFIVFPAADTPLALVEDSKASRILEVEASLNEGLLRATNELPLDAVLIDSEQEEGYTLTWHHLMLFQRFADLLTKPLLVSVPARITESELKALWEAGITGVVVEVNSRQPQDSLQKIRQVIDKLDFPSPRRREKPEAMLPPIGREQEIISVEEEEEE